MPESSRDPVINLAEAALRLGLNRKKALNIITTNGIAPVRTWTGIGYRMDDIDTLKKVTW
jgi:hypothetical protein